MPHALALAVAWCPQEPSRLGEVLIIPPDERGEPRILGRGSGSAEDHHPRLDFARHRPAKVELCPPLNIASISRAQLLVRSFGGERIAVTNVGHAPMMHNGLTATVAEVAPGDTIQLGRQLLLLCVSRPAWLTDGAVPPAMHPFGEPDEDGMVGESAAMWDLRESLRFVAARAKHVLIAGASGTGKELVARAIHFHSARSNGPFVSRNAATIPKSLIDAELFGNAKNYPNPGMADRSGLIGEADGGSIFLDEFTEMGQAGEAHLLRVLDDGEYQRLGETLIRRSRFRLIASTNRDPSSIKPDILSGLALRVDTPTLNERREDVPLLAKHLLRTLAAGDPPIAAQFFVDGDASFEPRISVDLMRALVTHDYETNVRELLGLLLESIRTSRGDELLPFTFPLEPPPIDADATIGADRMPAADAIRSFSSSRPAGARVTASLTPAEVQTCLDQNNGALEQTWRALGLPSRHALRRIIEKHRLEVRRRPKQR